MATKTKKGKKGAKAKSTAKNNGRTRASNEELDEQAAEVVRLRDEEDLSWAEVEEETGIASSRLRALYNRGGGKPTRERKGAAKAEEKPKGKSGKKGKKGKGKKRPS